MSVNFLLTSVVVNDECYRNLSVHLLSVTSELLSKSSFKHT